MRENGKWRFRYNEALYGEYNDWYLVSYIKFSKYKGDFVANGRMFTSRLTHISPVSQLNTYSAERTVLRQNVL